MSRKHVQFFCFVKWQNLFLFFIPHRLSGELLFKAREWSAIKNLHSSCIFFSVWNDDRSCVSSPRAIRDPNAASQPERGKQCGLNFYPEMMIVCLLHLSPSGSQRLMRSLPWPLPIYVTLRTEAIHTFALVIAMDTHFLSFTVISIESGAWLLSRWTIHSDSWCRSSSCRADWCLEL